MKRYAVISVFWSGKHLVDVELDGAFEEFDEAVVCYHSFDSTIIIDCHIGFQFDGDHERVKAILHERFPLIYPKVNEILEDEDYDD